MGEAPKFDTSSIVASRAEIHPLETIEYTITVRNSGGQAPSYLRVSNDIPTAAMYVSSSPDFELVDADRSLSWMGTLDPGQTKELKVTLIAEADSAGTTLSNRPAIHFDGAYWAVEHRLEIDSAPAQAGITPVGIGALLFFVLLIVAAVTRNRVGAALFTLAFGLGMLGIFAHMAYGDYRMFHDWRETRCTITDSFATFSPDAKARSRSAGSWKPQFAIRYPVDGAEQVSIGYASASALQFGSSKKTHETIRNLPRGATAPCWYDPADAKKVVLHRAIGGGYFFALFALIPVGIGILLLKKQRPQRHARR